ncbi:hypothetical protein HDU91_002230, partial [Kappamyces sp. JEL0680]
LLLRDLIETEEMLLLLKARISVEQVYASRLLELKQSSLSSNGFRKDESRLSSVVFLKYKTEMGTLALAHKNMADLMANLLAPIDRFIEICKKEMTPRAEAIVYGWKKYQRIRDDTLALEAKASEKWKALQGAPAPTLEEEVDEMLSTANMLTIGSRKVSADDFNALIVKLQNKVPSEDIWRMLGTYKDCYSGEAMLEYLKLTMSEADSREFLNYLCMYNYIKPISYTGTVNSFISTSHYQWKIFSAEFSNEPASKKNRREATRAALEAGRSAKQLESLRNSLDTQMLEYTNQAQMLMCEHIRIIKETLTTALEIEKNPLEAIKTLGDRLAVFLESLDPVKDVQAIVENEKTGYKHVPTFVAKVFPTADTPFQIFGRPLEDTASSTKLRVPALITKATAYLLDTYAVNPDPKSPSHLDIWLSPIGNFGSIHSLRSSVNGVKINRRCLRKFPPETIVG